MSGETSAPVQAEPAQDWRVRLATADDVGTVACAVRELLVELGGNPPDVHAMEQATRALVDDGAGGVVFVAQASAGAVGVLAASFQSAIHVPGRYALIQDLWVDPAWRSRAVGRGLIDALRELARERGLPRLEVGLPRESFARFGSTEAFYLANGFIANGPRMRLVLE